MLYEVITAFEVTNEQIDNLKNMFESILKKTVKIKIKIDKNIIGGFIADEKTVKSLIANGQVATQYIGDNPNGSILAIEGITSPDGRVFGKMGHSERIGSNICKNIYGEKDQRLFKAGVNYFK